MFRILHEILTEIRNLIKEIKTMSAGITALTTAITNLTAAVGGAATELSSLASQLGTSEDPQVVTLAAQVQAQADALNAAVTAASAPPATT